MSHQSWTTIRSWIAPAANSLARISARHLRFHHMLNSIKAVARTGR